MEKVEIKKIGIQMSVTVYDRLKGIADRYGITPNSLITYVIGQWVDSNLDMRENLTKQMVQSMVQKMSEMSSNDDDIKSKMFKDGIMTAFASLKEGQP